MNGIREWRYLNDPIFRAVVSWLVHCCKEKDWYESDIEDVAEVAKTVLLELRDRERNEAESVRT